MKKFYALLLTLSFVSLQIYSQKLVNLNPDPNGEPWYVGGLRKLTKVDSFNIEHTPKLTLQSIRTKGELPSFVDNSLNKYFRPIFNQEGGSCGQASGVAYNFTYAIDYARDLAANTVQTQYPSHYTWNFLNDGVGNGSFYFDGWEIIRANGCPNVETYGGTPWEGGDTRWMSGYNSYVSGMQNRTLDVFTIDVSTPEGLQVLKSWMNDQLDGSAVGGLANFAAGVSGTFTMMYLPTGTPEAYKSVITRWDSDVNHAMTFVGYNDSIRYDFNNDGKYTNNIDINNDNIVDMRDWEIGGLIMANSWGTGWGDDGKAYVMYRLLAEPSTNGGILNGLVHVIRAKAQYNPLVTLKATIKHTSRNKLRITAGVSSNPNATIPDYTLSLPLFNYQGGNYYMQGTTTENAKTIEIGIDITPLLSEIESDQDARFFLAVNENDPSNTASGEVVSFSVFDSANGNTETVCSSANVEIANNSTTYLHLNKSISFDKVSIPQQTPSTITAGFPFEYTLTANGGTAPYKWTWLINYDQNESAQPVTTYNTKKLEPSSDDDGFAELNLPFQFPFYGELYSKVLISTDGSILFSNNFEYVRNEANLIDSKAITVYGTDLMLYESDNDGIWYHSTRDSLTVHWKTSKYNNPSFNADFYATIFPSGKIKLLYGPNITPSNDWVAGISNGDKDNYLKATVAGMQTISGNTCITLNTTETPEGFKLSEDGKISFTTKTGDGHWDIKVKATDQKNIYSTQTISLQSEPSIEVNPTQLLFQNPMEADPFTVGKTITIHNSCLQNVQIDSVKTNGNYWYIDNTTTKQLTLNPNDDVLLIVKLKSSSTKSSNLISDSIKIYTPYTTYSIPILVDPEVLTNTTYAVNFTVMHNETMVENATIEINGVVNPLITDSNGTTSISLPNGNYSYTITVPNKYQDTDSFTVNEEPLSLTIHIIPSGIDGDLDQLVGVYPNPFKDELKIRGFNQTVKVRLLDILGKCIRTQLVDCENQSIKTEYLKAGVYIVIVDDEKGNIKSFKLVKI